jgi:hypothetical protein
MDKLSESKCGLELEMELNSMLGSKNLAAGSGRGAWILTVAWTQADFCTFILHFFKIYNILKNQPGSVQK